MSKLSALLIIGTRPEVIKMAPVVHECRRRGDAIQPLVCFTGQHRELVDQVAEYFGIAPDLDLDLMQPGQTLPELTARCLTGIDALVEQHRPDCIVAQGDTTTVMAAAVASFFRKVPFVHVEAGLRTGNLQAPWPEEFNRRVASLVGGLHCAPTQRAADNLLREGCSASTVHVTGNTVVDALHWTLERERKNPDHWRAKHPWLGQRRMVLVTGHRRENIGAGLDEICAAIGELAAKFADVEFVYPVHLNPQVQEPVARTLRGLPNVRLLPPVAYPEFVWLMDRAVFLLTDSGGVQEEALSLGKPVLLMRDATERPEGVEAGAVELVGTDRARIVERAVLLLNDPAELARRQVAKNPYGDGHAARRIVELIVHRAWQG